MTQQKLGELRHPQENLRPKEMSKDAPVTKQENVKVSSKDKIHKNQNREKAIKLHSHVAQSWMPKPHRAGPQSSIVSNWQRIGRGASFLHNDVSF